MDNTLSADRSDDASISHELRKQHDQDNKHSSNRPGDGTVGRSFSSGGGNLPTPNVERRPKHDVQQMSTDLFNSASLDPADSGLHSGSHTAVDGGAAASAEAPSAAEQSGQTHDSSTSIDGNSSIATVGTGKDSAAAFELDTSLASASAASLSQQQQQLPVQTASPESSDSAQAQQAAQPAVGHGDNTVQVYDMQPAHLMASMSPAGGAAPAAAAGGDAPDLQALLLAELQKEAGLDTAQVGAGQIRNVGNIRPRSLLLTLFVWDTSDAVRSHS